VEHFRPLKPVFSAERRDGRRLRFHTFGSHGTRGCGSVLPLRVTLLPGTLSLQCSVALETDEPDYASRGPGEPPGGVEPRDRPEIRHPGTESPSLIDLLEVALDESAWDTFSRGSAVRRAGRAGFARNVCVGLGQWGSEKAIPVLTSALANLSCEHTRRGRSARSALPRPNRRSRPCCDANATQW
jgi:hypothetical protein